MIIVVLLTSLKLIQFNFKFKFILLPYYKIYGLILYKRSFNKININDFKGNVWFSLEPGYGIESYGPIVNMYHLDKNTKYR